MSQIEDLLQRCTVKLTLPDRSGWGTGFFVAPGWILTCNHVVREAGGLVRVRWQGQENWAEAYVEELRSDPYDLALLRVRLPGGESPPWVGLDEVVKSRDPLYLFGYPDQDFPNGCPVTFGCEGWTGDEPALIKFALGQVRPGMSGSPLLNQRTGMVCGMVKFTRDRSFDLGGGAISTRVILEQFPQLRELQREFHEQDRRWVNLITTQAAINFKPYLQAVLANNDYREGQEVYTPTTVEDRRQVPAPETVIASQPRFSSRLKLRVETVKPDKKGDRPDGLPEPQEQVEQWDVLAGLRNYAAEHVVLIGKPGSGKSTSLERLLWEEAEKALQDPNARIPVLVKLRRCTGRIEGLIRDFLVGHQVGLEIAQVEELLRQGRFLLLLDGLNELPQAFEIELVNFRDRYRRTTPMIMSTRDLGGGGTLGIEKTLKMLPLTESQMREFVRGYLGEAGDRLFQQLQGDRLRKFAETPLLLWMLCRVFAHNGKVPDNLGLAFREFTQLHDQELQADAPADSKDQWHKLLRHLAFVMMQGKTLIDPQLSILKEEAEDCLTAYLQQAGRSDPREYAERWLKDLLKYHLIQPFIQPNFEEHIEFRHQLIQEYYAAEYLLVRIGNLDDYTLKRDYLNYLKWTEPMALMLALVDHEALAVRVVERSLEVDLMLGARLAGEVRTRSVGDVNIVEFKHTMQMRREEEVLRAIRKALRNEICVEEIRSETTKHAIELILKLLLPNRVELKLLGLTRNPEIVPYLLLSLDNSSSEDIHRTIIKALGQIGCNNSILAISKYLPDKRFSVRWEAIRALENIGNQLAAQILYQELLEDDSSIQNHYDDLSKIFKHLPFNLELDNLLNDLDDPEPSVRRKTARLLGAMGDPKAIFKLSNLLCDQDSEIKREAACALSYLSSEVALPVLVEALNTSNDYQSASIAAKALGNIGTDRAINALLNALEAIEDSNVFLAVIHTLGHLRSEKAIPVLLNLWRTVNVLYNVIETAENGDDVDVFFESIRASSHLHDGKTIFILLKLWGFDCWNLLWAIKETLIEIHSEKLCSDLIDFLQEKTSSSSSRAMAAESLGGLGCKESISALIEASRDENLSVREASIEALGNIGCSTCIKTLSHALLDENMSVKWAARLALAKNGVADEEALDHLIGGLQLYQCNCNYFPACTEDENLRCSEHLPGCSNWPYDCDYESSWAIYDDETSWAAAEALEHLDASILPKLKKSLLSNSKANTPHLEAVLYVIAAIQANCKFYNYEIFHSPPAKPQPTQQPPPATIINIAGDYIAGDKIGQDKILGNKTAAPNATTVKILENVENYHENPPRDPPP